MENYKYTVYHIPGKKIGCTTDFVKRMKDQGFTSWEILWEQDGDYDFGWIAGNKEIELQKQYGYPVDKSHYQISRRNRELAELSKSEEKKINNYSTKEASSRGGKTQTKKIDHQRHAAMASVKSENHNSKQRWLCPDGHITAGHVYQRYCKNRNLDLDKAIRLS